MRRWLLGSTLLVAALAACARVMAPPGGPRDTEPPRVIETDPPQDAIATQHAGTNRPVRIIFDETISERSPREMVMVSPETGKIDVDRKGRELRVRIEGGWQPGRVYRVTVLPGIVDRMGNARPAAYDLVFSTGGTITPNVIGGIATDRITGRPVSGARVEAIARADSTVFASMTDSLGFYAIRSLPAGEYDLRVFTDQNRNRTLDGVEARATLTFTIAETDTLAHELSLLALDTTAARLVRASPRDSLQVLLAFDDYMDPLEGINVNVTAWQLPDSIPIEGGIVMTQRMFDSLRVAQDTAQITPPGLPAQQDTVVLPVNELVWIPPAPLQPTTRYRVSVNGYRNLNGVEGGGGSVVFTTPVRARLPEPMPADSAPAAPADTTPAPPDTISRR